jgi:hypothetical protein
MWMSHAVHRAGSVWRTEYAPTPLVILTQVEAVVPTGAGNLATVLNSATPVWTFSLVVRRSRLMTSSYKG